MLAVLGYATTWLDGARSSAAHFGGVEEFPVLVCKAGKTGTFSLSRRREAWPA
jgi:hypothetical protein